MSSKYTLTLLTLLATQDIQQNIHYISVITAIFEILGISFSYRAFISVIIMMRGTYSKQNIVMFQWLVLVNYDTTELPYEEKAECDNCTNPLEWDHAGALRHPRLLVDYSCKVWRLWRKDRSNSWTFANSHLQDTWIQLQQQTNWDWCLCPGLLMVGGTSIGPTSEVNNIPQFIQIKHKIWQIIAKCIIVTTLNQVWWPELEANCSLPDSPGFTIIII